MSMNSSESLDNLESSAQPFGDGYVGFDSAQQFGSSPNFNTLTTGFRAHTEEFNPQPNAPILPHQEGYALHLWTRQNAVRLEEKELLEKQSLAQILEEADVYKTEFHKKRQAACETNKVMNREKEKVFLDSLEKFHVEADKDYWKSIAELVPNEVPVLEKKGKEKEKRPSIAIMQGPKPGKPTDLSRMRQTLIKLKHDTPAHLKPLFRAASADDVQVDPVASPEASDVEISTQPIAVA